MKFHGTQSSVKITQNHEQMRGVVTNAVRMEGNIMANLWIHPKMN